MVRQHHQLNGHEFEQTLGDNEGQESLTCCSPWGRRVGHDLATEQQQHIYVYVCVCVCVCVCIYIMCVYMYLYNVCVCIYICVCVCVCMYGGVGLVAKSCLTL